MFSPVPFLGSDYSRYLRKHFWQKMKCIPAQTSAASKPEMQAGSQSSDLIVLDKLSAMDLSGQIHLYLQLFQYPVAMRSVLQLDVM